MSPPAAICQRLAVRKDQTRLQTSRLGAERLIKRPAQDPSLGIYFWPTLKHAISTALRTSKNPAPIAGWFQVLP